MKKLSVVSFLICLALALSSASALAQDGEILIKPYDWDESTPVYSDQLIILNARWGACKVGAIQSFLSATNISWTLEKDGAWYASGEDTNQFWGPIQTIPLINDVCIGAPLTEIPAVFFEYPVGMLDAGDYNLHFEWWFDHPITDLADTDGDGQPDIYSDPFRVFDIVIHVKDRP